MLKIYERRREKKNLTKRRRRGNSRNKKKKTEDGGGKKRKETSLSQVVQRDTEMTKIDIERDGANKGWGDILRQNCRLERFPAVEISQTVFSSSLSPFSFVYIYIYKFLCFLML